MIEPPPAYDRKNEYENRNKIDAELAQKYDKRSNLLVPYGKSLSFVGTSGNLVTFGYSGGDFLVSIDGAAGTSIATEASVTAVNDKLTASYAVTVDVNGKISQLKLLSDGTTSTAAFTATTFKVFDDSSTNVAPFEVTGGTVKIKAANVGVLTAGHISTSTLSAIAADLGTITAGSIRLTSGSYAVNIAAGFGTSSDLILWYGSSSTAAGSATKTNGIFALATDGKVYYGGSELASAAESFDAYISSETNGVFVTAPDTAVVSATVTASGGTPSYTYAWALISAADGFTPSGTTTATLSLSQAYVLGGQSDTETWRCTITDDEGRTLFVTVIFVAGSL